MNKKIVLLLLLLLGCMSPYAQSLLLKKGLLIRKSVKVQQKTYFLDASSQIQEPLIIIEGNDITVDFNHALLIGSSPKAQPDEFDGIAILVRNCRNVTIRNLKAKGYKIALMAKSVEGLQLDHCDFSYNYRQRLNSTGQKEDVSDWMSYHQNEKDQWLRYGAAMYLRNCNSAIITNCTVTGGQNALMMMECVGGLIYYNNFSFNSGIGIGLYRSSGNRIVSNKLNFNIRGYSDGVYSRGQDSAGILVYEQSNDNLIYNNSVTHGGDGLFLWAGQTTMDTGKGGCNGNRIIGNDFSFAAANGIETTFSSNLIKGNRMFECDYGLWGGYSYNTKIMANQFRNNRVGVAIEHGQNNSIEENIFYQDQEAIQLWAGKEQTAGWGYPKYHDTRSVQYRITLNSFNRNPLVYRFSKTDSLQIYTNTYSNCEQMYQIDSTVMHLDTSVKEEVDTTTESLPDFHLFDPFKGNGKLAGKRNIMMTGWGPYDFRYPLIWNNRPADTLGEMKLNVIGPPGKWRLLTSKGLSEITISSDTFPATVKANRIPGNGTDMELVAEYIPKAPFTDQLGRKRMAGKPYRFYYRTFFQPIDFRVSWFDLDSLSNLPASKDIQNFTSGQPISWENVNQLDFNWWNGLPTTNHTVKRFLTIANGTAELPEGNYVINLTWKDAVRLFVDGRLLVDEWNPVLSLYDEAPHKKVTIHLNGRHQFRVEHMSLGGNATLVMKIQKPD